MANGETVRAGGSENEDLFKAVVGGQGLVGVIVLVSITLLKRPEENVIVEKRRLANLNDLMEALKAPEKQLISVRSGLILPRVWTPWGAVF